MEPKKKKGRKAIPEHMKRKSRKVYINDLDWQSLGEVAESYGISISQYLLNLFNNQ